MGGDIIDIRESLSSTGCPHDDNPVYSVYDDSQISEQQIKIQTRNIWYAVMEKKTHKPTAVRIVCCYGNDLHDLLKKIYTQCIYL